MFTKEMLARTIGCLVLGAVTGVITVHAYQWGIPSWVAGSLAHTGVMLASFGVASLIERKKG